MQNNNTIRKSIKVINNVDDLDCLTDEEYLNKDYHLDKLTLFRLKSYIKNKIDSIIIEDPYYDSDYLSTYYYFYAKKHRKYVKESVRVHFFKSNEYCGYITIRPTVDGTKLGKSYLSAKIFAPSNAKVITSNLKVHLLGEEHIIEAFPWMQQETDIAVCAHVAIWSILRFYSTKFVNYHNITMGGLVDILPENMNRKIPAEYVNVQQIPDAFKKLGFSPIVISKDILGEETFFEELVAYLESGIPIIGCMSRKKHAFSIIGYREMAGKDKMEVIEKKKLVDNGCHMMYNSTLINELVVNDDNYFPYKIIGHHSDYNPFIEGNGWDKNQKFIEDIDYLIIPLYDRMQYSYSSVKNAIEAYLEGEDLLSDNKFFIIRPYISSANSIKEYAYTEFDDSKDNYLWDIIPRTTMPRFIWCIEVSTINEFVQGLVSSQFVIDITCNNIELQPWIYILERGKFKRYGDNAWEEAEINLGPFKKFYNLKEYNHE